MIRKKIDIEDILDFVDREILVKYLFFTPNECVEFRKIWRKLKDRRMKRNL